MLDISISFLKNDHTVGPRQTRRLFAMTDNNIVHKMLAKSRTAAAVIRISTIAEGSRDEILSIAAQLYEKIAFKRHEMVEYPRVSLKVVGKWMQTVRHIAAWCSG